MNAIKTSAAVLATFLLGGCLSWAPGLVSRAGGPPAMQLEPNAGAKRLMSPAPHHFRQATLSLGDPVRRGSTSERYELRDGDCDNGDCSKPRARAEIQLDQDVHPSAIGQDIWYGYSFFNATVPAFDKENSLRLVFGQWTMGGKAKPIFRFIQLGHDESDFTACRRETCQTRNRDAGDLVVQLEDIAKANSWGDAENDGYVCRLFDLEKNRGKWVDLMINTNYSTGADGYLRVWVNQRLMCNYNGPLVSPASVAAADAPKHRRGIYSSWNKRWRQSQGTRPHPALVVYYDEFRVGQKMSDVDVRQHDAAGLKPVD